MTYKYVNKTSTPNLDTLEGLIKTSSIVGAYVGFEWNRGCNTTHKPPCSNKCEQPCNGDLYVVMNRELTVDERVTLDGLVASA